MIAVESEFSIIKQLLKERKWEKAEPILEQVEKNSDFDNHQKIQFFLLKSKYLVKTFNFQEAEECLALVPNDLLESLDVFYAIDKYLIQADLARGKGNLEGSLKQLKNANYLLSQEMSIQKIEKKYRLEYMYDIKGNILMQRGEFNKVLRCFEKRLKIANELKDPYLIFFSYHHLGFLYRFWGKFGLAIKYHKEGLTISENLNDNNLRSLSYTMLGLSYGKLGEMSLAIEYGRKGVKFARKISKETLMHALNNLGVSYWANGFLNNTINQLTEALEIANEINDKKTLAIIYNNLGLINFAKGHLEQALQFYNASLVIKNELNDLERQRHTLGNIGQVYAELENYDLAITYYNQCLELYKLIEDKIGESNVLFDLNALFLKMKDFLKTEKVVDELKILSEETKEPIIINRYLLTKAALLSSSMRKDEKNRALEIYKSVADQKETQFEIYYSAHLHLCELLFESYIETGKPMVLNLMNRYLQKVLTKSEKENLFYIKSTLYLLMGRLELLLFKPDSAEKFFKQVKQQAEKRGYDTLTKNAILDLDTVQEYNSIHKIVSKEKIDHEKKQFKEEQKMRIQNFLNEIASKIIEI